MNTQMLSLAFDLPTLWPDLEPEPELPDVPPVLTGLGVRLSGVEKRFDDRQVLRGIDLEIGAGEFVAVVGRSGCGKSTLLRLLAGLDQPTAGRIELDGAARLADDVRLMFQDPRLLPWASVRRNVEVGVAGLMRLHPARAAAEALARVGLGDRAGDWPAALSGGQKQRVALARALVSRPGVLALDEPLGALDALTRIRMQELIEQSWRSQGFTAVLVTHDVAEAVVLADRVLVLEEGRITCDVSVDLPRPRRRGDPETAALEGRILERLLRG